MFIPRWCFLLAALAACSTEDDQRPPTLEVMTLTVLAPNCGQVQCHSTFTTTKKLAFDTIEAARRTLGCELGIDEGLNPDKPTGREPHGNDLWNVITAYGKQRMPPDSPLADADIALISTWLEADAPGRMRFSTCEQ